VCQSNLLSSSKPVIYKKIARVKVEVARFWAQITPESQTFFSFWFFLSGRLITKMLFYPKVSPHSTEILTNGLDIAYPACYFKAADMIWVKNHRRILAYAKEATGYE
jgi:hypothetical protein